jgi:hypothetical protein
MNKYFCSIALVSLIVSGCAYNRSGTPAVQSPTPIVQLPSKLPSYEDILAVARRQQDENNLEISRQILGNNADTFINSSDEYHRYLLGWLALDKKVLDQLPVTVDFKISRDKTQGEAYLKKAFDHEWNN